jgi:hypothetical protein
MKFKVIYSFFGLLLGAFFLMGNSGGATGGAGARTGAPSEGLCSNCHGGGSFTPSISIQMLNGATPISSYTAGNSYTLRVQISGGSSYGAQATVLRNSDNNTAGTLSGANSGAAIRTSGIRSYLEHTSRSTTGVFTATWVAPATGTGAITIYGAGIVCNATGGTSGDNATNGTLVLSEAVAPTATISYSSSNYCQNTTDPTPTITGTQGGSFSANPTGLSINATSGQIDVSASTPNSYTITYTFAGGSTTTVASIVSVSTASINYSSNSICQSSINPSPTVTGSMGGTFSSSSGLNINSSSGTINLAASTVGNYVVTYLPLGTCANATTFNLTITPITDAAFNYSAISFCQNQLTVSPASISNAGGSFSASAGLSLNATTGGINLSTSTVGSYNIIYTTSGSCIDSDTVSLTITASPSAAFNYSSPNFCPSALNISPNITGNSGGTFSATPAGLSINANTGSINPANSSVGNYQITYAISGACAASQTQNLTVNPQDSVSFSYANSSYCLNTGASAMPTLTTNATGNFSATPQGLVFVDSLTGAINTSLSQANSYTISYITDNICPDTATAVISLSVCSGINQISQNTVKISPNPSKGNVWLDIPNANPNAFIQVRIIDAQGRQVYQQQNLSPQQNLDLQQLPAGIYWLHLQADRQTWQQTLRIE